MTVIASKRREAPNEPIMLLGDLRVMITHDLKKITQNTPKFVSENVVDTINEISDFGDRYARTYITKGNYENGLRRNIYLILMCEKLYDLNCYLPSFFDVVPKITKNRMLKYTELINDIIDKNEARIKRDINMGDELFKKIHEFDKITKRRCKEIMADPDYKFQRGVYYYRSSGEKAVYVKKTENLKKYTLKQIKKMGEIEISIFGKNIYRIASDMFYCCYSANNILPLCIEEYGERKDWLTQAKMYLQSYDRELTTILSGVYYDNKTANAWSKKVKECYRLINAIMKSDKDRFSKLDSKDNIEDFDKKKLEQRKAYNAELKKASEKKAEKSKTQKTGSSQKSQEPQKSENSEKLNPKKSVSNSKKSVPTKQSVNNLNNPKNSKENSKGGDKYENVLLPWV